MDIQARFHDAIRAIDVNSHKVSCDYKPWKEKFKGDSLICRKIAEIEQVLGKQFGRAELVEFYKGNADVTTKFLSAMIWGNEAPAGSKKDNRGPSRVAAMLKGPSASKVLGKAKIGNQTEILAAYEEMDKSIEKCGPSFITKHLYFLGKSSGNNTYPLIFDDRVAVGLVRVSVIDSACLDYVSIHAERKASAYAGYLKYVARQASLIGCELDNVEYYLFTKGG